MRAWMLVIAALAGALAPPDAPAQHSIDLRRTARVAPGEAVRLGDVAAVGGPDADRLAGLVLIPEPGAEPAGPGGWITIDLERVRTLLQSDLGDRAGMVALSGSACAVRIATPPAQQPAPAPAPAAPESADLVTLPTVRGAVARELCRILAVPPDAVRLDFEAGDRGLLDLPTEGRVLEIAPTGASDRMPVSVTVHGPDGRMVRKTIRVDLQVRRPVAVAARAIERGSAIGPDDILAEERWVPPGSPAVSPEDAANAVARRRITPGEPLDIQSIEPPLVIRRGDRVSVRVVTGRWVVRREAAALEDGREGDEIAFAAASDSRQRFRATVSGRGQAVAWSGHTGRGTGLAILPARD